MEDARLEQYWNDIPIGKENSVTRPELCVMWGMTDRTARSVLHELSRYDNGDDFILIRSSKNKGFYRTSDPEEIGAYRKECINKGRSHFAPLRKINRVTAALDSSQYSMVNNLRLVRTGLGMKQTDVCEALAVFDSSFDASMLSKMESGKCVPTPFQLVLLSHLYGCSPGDLMDTELYQAI